MKKVLTLLIIATITSSAMAQVPAKHKKIKMTKTSGIINVSADDLWEIVGPGFSNVGVWASSVDHAVTAGEPKFEGATCSERTCDLNAKGFDKILEIITIYNPKDRILAFDVIEGLPGFVYVTNSNWAIKEIAPGQSQIEITVTIKAKRFMGSLMGGMFKANLNKAIPTIIQDLTIYAETGEISDTKKKRKEKMDKKLVAAK